MKKTILMTAVMLLAFSVAASAQALYQVGSTPVTTVSSCGTTELTGPINILEAVGSLPTVTGTITIVYGVAITNTANLTITVNGAVNPALVSNISTAADLAAGRLVLSVTPGATNITSIVVSGVRVNIAGNPGLTSLTAQLTATGNSFVGGQTSVVVISSIASAIASVAGAPALTINALTPGISTTTITATEGFVNAWVLGSVVGVTFSPVPAGIQLYNFPLTIGPDTQGTIWQEVTDSTGATLTTAATSPVLTSATVTPAVFYKVTTAGATADVAVQTLPIPLNVSAQPTATIPLSPGTLTTVTADMNPRAGAIPPTYSGTTCQKTSTGTLITIVPATTNLLIPYATTLAGYDTGLAIANTTSDPFTAANTITKQDGSLTFYLFPAGGAMFTITPTGTAGGLTGGVLKSGNEYVYLLSSLLADAGKPAAFSGYIFVVCNFTNGHGQYFISNFEAFTNGALMLVNPLPRTNFESLGQ